jgi:16S rRNA (cytidine1402-2'-O)-methyltransferase
VAGTLYLLPCPIAESSVDAVLPAEVKDIAHRVDYFLAENAKSTRAFLKAIDHPRPLRELTIVEIGHRPAAGAVAAWLQPVAAGRDAALVSEAGCPAVADPGAGLVAAAHARGLRVRPLVGPSSLLLALMAAGLEGQRFRFHGYLPIGATERAERLASLERASRAGETQFFIETPYRSSALFAAIVAVCEPQTRLCVAIDLTGPAEYVQTHRVVDWRHSVARPPVERQPAVFLLLA